MRLTMTTHRYMHGLPEAAKQSADVLLIVEKQELPAHQFPLAANCEVFASMLLEAAANDDRSSQAGGRLRIPLPGDRVPHVVAALGYMYRSTVCSGASPTPPSCMQEAMGLARFGHKYSSKGLCTISEDYLVERTQAEPSLLSDTSKLASCIVLAEDCKMHRLLANCELYMINNPSEELWLQIVANSQQVSKASLLRVLRGLAVNCHSAKDPYGSVRSYDPVNARLTRPWLVSVNQQQLLDVATVMKWQQSSS